MDIETLQAAFTGMHFDLGCGAAKHAVKVLFEALDCLAYNCDVLKKHNCERLKHGNISESGK